MNFQQITFLHTDWCYLYELYDLGLRRSACPGRRGQYSAETEDGVPFLAFTQGHDAKTGKPLVMCDQVLSSAYPSRLFVHGEDQDRNPLPPESIYAALKSLGVAHCPSRWHSALVHRGYDRGKTTWHHALRAHTDYGVNMWDVGKLVTNPPASSGWELIGDYHHQYVGGDYVRTIELYKELTNEPTKRTNI